MARSVAALLGRRASLQRMGDSGAAEVYVGEGTPQQPRIGDLRLSWELARPATASCVAVQRGDSLGPLSTRAGPEIELFAPGSADAAQLIKGYEVSEPL